MTMGFLLDDQAGDLRGPMATRYTQQFLRQVAWGELDYLVLDLPPGTGDIQLTIVQTVALGGTMIVTTPQEVALIDARKASTMFAKVNVPVLGLIENMSHFICPTTESSIIFLATAAASGRRNGSAPHCLVKSRLILQPGKLATAQSRSPPKWPIHR